MKTTLIFIKPWLIFLMILSGMNGFSQEVTYYAVEINGILCGYSESEMKPVDKDGKAFLQVTDNVEVKMSLLGQDVEMKIRNDYCIDESAPGSYTFCKHFIETGVNKMVVTTRIVGDTAFFQSGEGLETLSIYLEPGTILESKIQYSHLLKDFVEGHEQEKEYQVFDDMQGEIVTKEYTVLNEETLTLAGNTYETLVLNELNRSNGVTIKLWLLKEEGYPVRIDVSNRSIYLADASVKKRIQMADMDNLLFAKVNKVIPDIQNITYMKVQATIESAGEWLTPEALNFSGQKFEGTVDNNLIEGVFELNTQRYEGTQSPGFPYDAEIPDGLQKYIEPEMLIESDHPEIVEEAKKITAGSRDSWEAVVSLSTWVGNNIQGAVPGGTSAINTYRTREGECGSHSRLLAAFCRAVGIPARLSIGCMYSSYLGGSFGQHAWTEVYMGDAGWIAVDATANEFDYVDAGHIRLGEKSSFNPKEMEILAYRIGDEATAVLKNEVPDEIEPLVGKYTMLESGKVFRIFYQDASLNVDIPGAMILALEEPDETGRWYPKMTRQINFTFLEDDEGKIEKVCLQQRIPVPKTNGEGEETTEDQETIARYSGNYDLAQAKASFPVTCQDGVLFIDDPILNKKVELEHWTADNSWHLKNEKNYLFFEENSEGLVQSMVYFEHIMLERGEPISVVMKEWIDAKGIEEGIVMYKKTKEQGEGEYIFSEGALNSLGYDYLNQGKTEFAIRLFELNVEEYPESWNVYDSLAEAYIKAGKKQEAEKSCTQSLKLNPNNNHAKEMLNQLNNNSL
jgi:hypothetical protein